MTLRCMTALSAALVLQFVPFGVAAATPPEPFELNAIMPLTGGGAFLGNEFLQTFHAAEIVINKTGGIGGHPLKFVVADNGSSAPTSVQLMNGLIGRNLPVIFDGGPAAVCNATIPLVQKSGPVDYCITSSIYPAAGGYVFSAGVPTPAHVENIMRYLRLRGWTRLAVITGTDATGMDFDTQIARVLTERDNAGMKIIAHEHFNVSDLSVAAQMANIKASNPQVVLTWSTGTPFGTLLHGIKDAGLDLPVVGVASNESIAEMHQYAADLPRELYFASGLGAVKNDVGPGPIRDAQIAYYEAFRSINVRPDSITSVAWDPVMIVVSALRAIGPKATANQVRDYILRLHGWAGVNGIYDFHDGSQRGIGASAGNIQTWDPKKDDFVAVSRPRGFLK